jgi:hypothetical protein
MRNKIFLLFLLIIPSVSFAAPLISNIQENSNDVGMYEKFELSFDVDTATTNPYFPYDENPPPGIDTGIGVTINVLFTPDDWATVYSQPAFYYQEFEDQVKSGGEWFYPTDNYYWKARFSPNQFGEWQYKIVAEDSGGITETQTMTFSVHASNKRGFIRVSDNDPRYFEYEDQTYYPGLGYNMNFNHVDWEEPVLENEENFQKMNESGIQLVRMWLSQWGIYGSAYNPWKSIDSWWVQNLVYRAPGFNVREAHPESELSMKVDSRGHDICIFLGWLYARPALKRNTDYRVRVRYKTQNITGPTDPAHPYGFVVKTGGWLWDDTDETKRCYYPGTGTVISPYQSQNTPDWQVMQFTYNSGNNDFLPYFYFAMENTPEGTSYIDHIWMEEDLGNGQYGPNVIYQPDMDHHLYIQQRQAYSFDKALSLAERYNIDFKLVIHEKNDAIFNSIDFGGNFTTQPDYNGYFYGNWRETTKVRWLQKMWWRYLQARWGYSPNIHSWELVNEGDPFHGVHYTLTDELAKYMHYEVFGIDPLNPLDHPNDHMSTTSTWHSFPIKDFWNNSNYPYIDFADVHFYAHEGSARSLRVDKTACCEYIPIHTAEDFYDVAALMEKLSTEIGAFADYGVGKPVIRGEFGLWDSNDVTKDTDGIWVHNYVWSQINSGGMYDEYWAENTHIYSRNGDGTYNFDHRDNFRSYYDFIKDIPLTNGNYKDIEASTSHQDLRVLGQKDILSGKAHLWIQNKKHGWGNTLTCEGTQIGSMVCDPINSVSGTITIPDMPSGNYKIEWWDTYSGGVYSTDYIQANSDLVLTLPYPLEDDIAARIETTDISPSTTTTTTPSLDDAPQWFNLRTNPLVVIIEQTVQIIVDWWDNSEITTVIISENSTGIWVNHTLLP